MKNQTPCDLCGSLHSTEDLHEFNGKLLCSDCLEANTVLCQECGKRVWISENAGNDTLPLCQSCYDRGYLNCVHCGHLMREQDAYYDDEDDESDNPYCFHCYTRHHYCQSIKKYYYKPDPLFRGDGPRYFGVELEIDGAGESNLHANRILSIANLQLETIYCKHDGSLDEGFEIVPHPMSLTYHKNEMPWRAVLDTAVEMVDAAEEV